MDQMPMDENQMILEMLQQVMGRWQQGEAQLAGEKQALVQTLAQLAGVGGMQGGMPPMGPGGPAIPPGMHSMDDAGGIEPPAEPMPNDEIPAQQVPMGMM